MINAAAIVGIEFVIVAIICGFLIRYYQSSLVTLDVSIAVYISWVFGYAAVLILPYDLSIAIADETQSPVLVELWVFVYWSTFFLAWVVLPIQMEYHNSGHFSFKEKLFDALKSLFLAALAAFVIAMIYIIYILSTNTSSISQVLGFAMAMSNTYGIVLITLLMGSGLAGIPKRLWMMGNIDGELTRLYLSAPHVEDAYQEARYELEDCEVEVKKAIEVNEKNAISSLNKAYVDTLKDKVSNFNFANKSSTRSFVKTDPTKNKDYTSKKELVALHARLMKCQLRARASERRWRVLITECKQLKDSKNPDITAHDMEVNWCYMPIANEKASTAALSTNIFYQCYFKFYKFWITKCYTPTCRIGAITCAFFSIIILWCELVMASSLESPIGYMMGAYSSSTEPVLVQAVAFVALAYMSVCTYWTLFRINIGWYYRLQGPQLSAPSSLIFNAEYLSRIQFALGYNFLLCLNIDRTKYAAFRRIMQNIQIIPVFGTQFTVYVPIIMIVIALFTLFDLFARILKLFGIESEESSIAPGLWCNNFSRSSGDDVTSDMDTELLEKYKTGKTVIENEIRQLVHQSEQLKVIRERSSFTESNSGSSHHVLSKIQLNNYSSHEEDEDDEEKSFGLFGKKKRNSKRPSQSSTDESHAPTSIFSSTLTVNNSSSSQGYTSVRNPLRDDFSNNGSGTGTGKSKLLSAPTLPSFPSKGYTKLGKTAPPVEETKANVKAKNVFSFDDEDDNSNAYGGRYTNI